MNKTSDYALAAIGATFVATVVALAFGFIGAAMALWLWNVIAIPVFGAPVITYWQMYGLMILIRLILPTATTTKKGND